MLIKNLEQARGRQGLGLLPLFLTLLVAVSFWPAKAQAQITGNLEADIPFQSHVGNTTLPAGRYTIHQLQNSSLTAMQISSADGNQSALFSVESAQARTSPDKPEMIFNKYGDRYFLSEMFDAGNADGNRLAPSRDEKRAMKDGGADVARVEARHPQQQGK